MPREVRQVLRVPREEIIHSNHFMAFGQQTVAKVRAQKARSTSHKDSHERNSTL